MWASIQCREPKTGQQTVQLYYEDNPLCLSSYIIYLQFCTSARWVHLPNKAGAGGHDLKTNCHEHKRRIKTEGKAKVVACVWGEEFIQFLAAQAVLH